jgi:photosynthetic reaction center cytochrome c subunit
MLKIERVFATTVCGLLFYGFSTLAFCQSTSPQEEAKKGEYLSEVQQLIGSRGDEPAENIFHNIEILRGKKASRLPGMMEALTGLLGVNCSFCHIPGHWELDEKPPKMIARKHFKMQASINEQYFNNENKISCWTCHHGRPQAELVPSDSAK